MDHSLGVVLNEADREEFRLSWVAYLRVFPSFFVMISIAYLLGINEPQVMYFVICLACVIVVYRVLEMRSVVLFFDEQGVWVYRGILPWLKRLVGIRWSDFSRAEFNAGFFSWLFNSYTVIVINRFTGQADLVLPSVSYGDIAVGQMNFKS